ncbi:putative alpha-1A adrenergic receptor [Apostichopus japonicus]|uniref:Putative alpha-1A adrenergic receptor n=1 Tax=Stichopus japonicus TaxID=307972 RepID=A0A2G8LGF2_STIJA|nr:putative alpha-1A adrenergic receptor [Apostichopus japonicus]
MGGYGRSLLHCVYHESVRDQHRPIYRGDQAPQTQVDHDPRRACWLIVLVWISSFSIAVGPLFGWRPPKDDPLECPLSNQVDYVVFSVIGSFYVPTLVIVVLYFKIYRAVCKESKKLKTNSRDDDSEESPKKFLYDPQRRRK